MIVLGIKEASIIIRNIFVPNVHLLSQKENFCINVLNRASYNLPSNAKLFSTINLFF